MPHYRLVFRVEMLPCCNVFRVEMLYYRFVFRLEMLRYRFVLRVVFLLSLCFYDGNNILSFCSPNRFTCMGLLFLLIVISLDRMILALSPGLHPTLGTLGRMR